MAAVESNRASTHEQTSIIAEIEERHNASPWVTRREITAEVAEAWLRQHAEITVTQVDLSKTLQQMLTEIFHTGPQRRRIGQDQFSLQACALLDRVGASLESFAAARGAAISADIPNRDALVFARLAAVLAPLAAAVQLSRIPVADAAAQQLLISHPDSTLTRKQLRGFVVGQVRPHAQRLLSRVGTEGSANDYLGQILEDVAPLAAAVVAAAVDKQARPTTLSTDAAEHLRVFAREELPRLRRAAARYGQHADDIVATTMLKLAAAMRTNSPECLNYPYALRAMANTAKDFYTAMAMKSCNEILDTEQLERVGDCGEDAAFVDTADFVLQHVLTVADRLDDHDAASERARARQTLLRYFLADPAVVDRRRARLAAHVLTLSALGDDEVKNGLQTVAIDVAPNRVAAQRITMLALAALRAP